MAKVNGDGVHYALSRRGRAPSASSRREAWRVVRRLFLAVGNVGWDSGGCLLPMVKYGTRARAQT
jgi:hypothetical protein